MSPRRRAAILSFPLALIAALSLLLFGELSYHRSQTALQDTTDAYDVRLEVERLLRLMVDAESGQRGYLLTGRTDYLKPFAEATQSIGQLLLGMTRFYLAPARSEQMGDFARLARLVETKISEMDVTLQARRDGRENAWRAVIESEIGRETQEQLRQQAVGLALVESARLQSHQAQVSRTLLISRIGVATMTMLSLLAFYFYLRQARQVIALRERQREVLEAERDTLDLEVRERTAQLTELARYLQTSQENQRSLLARELHDELGALLTSAKLDVARLQSRLPAISPEARERIAHLNEVLNSGIALKRRIIEDLRPSALGNLGLLASLDILTREFAKSSGLEVQATLEPVELAPDGELTVYRFVQEALTNIAKYAKAERVDVVLQPNNGGVDISVRDNGKGFDPAVVRSSAHGLVGMRYRVEAERGSMEIDAKPGGGTLLRAWLPSSAAEPSAKP
ncbi:MAG: CHASE3 domain-containing protein [Methylibium sp.]|uniref:CHASE3 domain-containing protein n=1 Tax=Methylibium sp. TaxID=2067992 RepID=UPI001791BE01|nr:CHASE3 domain-containing protein [Methylibium sp.]MBA3598948.1 CHASE3 domain-containing protein [Methylibium sp.]